jgi:hypothetical protein
MSLDKSIASGKEKRKPYYKEAQRVSMRCRTKRCLHCKGNKLYKNKKREEKFAE